jgi:HK97 family phage major capsid protein
VTAPTVDKSRVKELRLAAEAKAAEIEGLASAWKVEDGNKLVVTTEQKNLYMQASAEAKEIAELLAAAEGYKEVKGFLDAPAGTPLAGTDAAEAYRAAQQPQLKSLGQAFLDSDGYKSAKDAESWRNQNFHMQMSYDGSIFGAARAEQKDVYGGGYPGQVGGTITLPVMGGIDQRPMIDIRRRQSHVRDLFPSTRTNAEIIWGVRETGWTNNAAQVSQRTQPDGSPATGSGDVFGLKPKSDIALAAYSVPIATIAHLLDAHRNILSDEPRLQDFIDRRLREGIMFAEDAALLFGTGGAERITGIFNTPGIQVYPAAGVTSTPDKKSLQLRKASTRVMLAEYEATGVVIHPLDWEDIETETDANGALFVAVSVAIGAEKRIWRLNVVDTTAMTEGRYLLGAFGNAAQFYDREAVGVAVSTENRDNWERNVVTFRAEERCALTVDRPEAFVAGSFLDPTP